MPRTTTAKQFFFIVCMCVPPLNAASLVEQELRDLHCVERCALPDLVSANKEVQAVLVLAGDVAPYPAHENVVLVAGVQRGREGVGGPVVANRDPRRTAQKLPRPLLAQGPVELEVDGLGVGPDHGNADAGCRDADVVVRPDLLRLLDHLQLLLVVPVVLHRGVVREEVEGVLKGEDVLGDLLALEGLLRLKHQLIHGGLPRARSGLVCGHDHPPDAGLPVQRGDGHERDDRGAVRVGDDPAGPFAPIHPPHGLRVDLRDHQRDPLGHPKRGGVVHHHGACVGREGAELLAYAAARRKKGDVDVPKTVLFKLLHHQVTALELHRLSRRTGTRQELQFL
mmetsp:Transcript_210/g.797  ORF Transcript_210/g.797 Transcript_210/m.797 type:complete len:338 (-) Transcript_210:342-1355(-)